jgi:hypothetical protein
MTAKEKAKQLVYMYWDVEDIDFSNSIKCALIAVDEILDLNLGFSNCDENNWAIEKFYIEVKQEIEKL